MVLCPVNGTGGRVEASVRHVNGTIRFRRDAENKIHAVASVGFEIALWDRSVNSTEPVQECRYEGSIRLSYEGRDTLKATEQAAGLATGGERKKPGPPFECASGGKLNGTFRLEHENGSGEQEGVMIE
jgi:hypothetical protein